MPKIDPQPVDTDEANKRADDKMMKIQQSRQEENGEGSRVN